MRGVFITLEGGEAVGKTTQIRLLASYLTRFGFTVVQTREPGGCPTAECIRELVLGPDGQGMSPVAEALLFAAARAEHVEKVIAPSLARGEIVLCDRFIDSSLAYQGAGRALGQEWIRRINQRSVGDFMPDRTYLLTMNAVSALRRRNASEFDRIEKETGDFHERVENAFLDIARAERGRVLLVDASKPVTEVARSIEEDIGSLLRIKGMISPR